MMEKYFAHLLAEVGGGSQSASWRWPTSMKPWGEVFSMSLLAIQLLGAHQRRQRAARRKCRAHVRAPVARSPGGASADRINHERRAHQHLAGAPHERSVYALSGRRLAIAHRRSRNVGQDPDIPDAELWAVRRHLSASWWPLRANARAPSGASGNAQPSRSWRAACCSIRTALTIGFARRFATYKRAALLVARCEAAGCASSTIRRARFSLFLRARRIRPTIPASVSFRICIVSSKSRQPQRPPRLPGRLRHECGAASGAGRRCVAEHAASPDGSQRHQRRKGRPERRAELLRPRRLVA